MPNVYLHLIKCTFLYFLFLGDANKLKSAEELIGQQNWSYVSTREYFILILLPSLLLIFKELFLRIYEHHLQTWEICSYSNISNNLSIWTFSGSLLLKYLFQNKSVIELLMFLIIKYIKLTMQKYELQYYLWKLQTIKLNKIYFSHLSNKWINQSINPIKLDLKVKKAPWR